MADRDAELQAQLEALFLEELQDNVGILASGIAALRTTAGGDDIDAVVQQLFRAAHSLKGAAHSAGVTRAIGPCHRLEELLAEVRSGDRAIDDDAVSALLEDHDALVALERDLGTSAVAPRPDDPVTATAVGAGPSPATPRPTLGDGRARVAVARLDQLVHRTGALLSSIQQVRSLADEIEAVAQSTAAAQRHWPRSPEPTGGTGVPEPVPDVLGRLGSQARDVDRQLRHIAAQVSDTAQELRLQPFREVVAGLDRTVRELCRSTGAQARLVVDGAEVELDRDVGDAIREPLLHLVRNAVDHGIKGPEERTAVGKPPTGTVRVSAVAHGTHVVVIVSDDGGGLDVEALRASAPRSDPGSASVAEPSQLAFLPGLSTAKAITDVSGRGIGLDAARAKIESLGGTIHLRSEAGQGTEVELHVPRTLAVLRVVVAEVGRELVALPMANLTRLHRLTGDDVEHLEDRLTVMIAGHRHPAVPLSRAAGLAVDSTDATETASSMVAVEVAEEEGVLLVDRVDTELDVVLQPVPARLAGVPGVLGAALLPIGRAALVMNPSAMLRAGLASAVPPLPSAPASRRATVLLAEDTLTTRALERSILEGAGYDVIVAVDGAEALEALHEHDVDVVVSDVDMPRMSGIDLCRAMRASAKLTDVPVILVTSLASDDDRRRGLEVGADAYLVKSAFDQAALLDAVKRFV